MKVKICGVCRPQDAAAAAHAGADFLGVIFAPGRRRTQTEHAGAKIFAQAGALKRVGVFANQTTDEVTRIAASLELDVIQLHGHEDEHSVARLAHSTGCMIWKSVWPRAANDLTAAVEIYYGKAHGLLLDAQYGGSGVTFDWRVVGPARTALPPQLTLIVAGGLTPANVAVAIAALRPDVVDVATGVESALGEKSQSAITAFVRNARI